MALFLTFKIWEEPAFSFYGMLHYKIYEYDFPDMKPLPFFHTGVAK